MSAMLQLYLALRKLPEDCTQAQAVESRRGLAEHRLKSLVAMGVTPTLEA
jgi:hypothetical protein